MALFVPAGGAKGQGRGVNCQEGAFSADFDPHVPPKMSICVPAGGARCQRRSVTGALSVEVGAYWRAPRVHMAQYLYQLVSESQLPLNNVNFILEFVIVNDKLTIVWGSWTSKTTS